MTVLCFLSDDAVVIMLLLASLNSCCNPWIYLAFSGNMLSHLNPCRCKNNNVINSPYEGKLRHLCLCSCADSRTNGLSLNLNIQRESVTSTKSTVVTFSSEPNKFKSVAIPLKDLNWKLINVDECVIKYDLSTCEFFRTYEDEVKITNIKYSTNEVNRVKE